MSQAHDEGLKRSCEQPGDHLDGVTLNRIAYTDPAMFEREAKNVILPHWHCAGHESSIPAPGQFLNVELCGESVLVVRGRDNAVRGLLNVCRHRGSRLCREPAGIFRNGLILCPYHAWSYDADGSLRAARDAEDGLDKSQFALQRIHLMIIEGLIFISFADTPPGMTHVEEVLARSARAYGWRDAKVAHREVFTISANWKLVVENYYECSHCGPSHPEFSRFHMDAKSVEETTLAHRSLEVRTRAMGIDLRDIDFWFGEEEPGEEPAQVIRAGLTPGAVSGTEDGQAASLLMGELPGFDGGTTYFDIGPTSAFLAYSDYGVIYRFLPRDVGRTDMEVTWLVSGKALEGKDYDRDRLTWLWRVTSQEDKRIIEDNQAGVSSRFYIPGPYSPKETHTRRFSDWMRRELATTSTTSSSNGRSLT